MRQWQSLDEKEQPLEEAFRAIKASGARLFETKTVQESRHMQLPTAHGLLVLALPSCSGKRPKFQILGQKVGRVSQIPWVGLPGWFCSALFLL